MGDEGSSIPSKWRQRLIGAIGAVLLAIPATLIGVAVSDHADRLHEFRDAQTQCKKSLALAAVESSVQADVAHQHAMEEPKNDAPASLWTSINNAKIDCLKPPLDWPDNQLSMWPGRTISTAMAWQFRNLKYPGSETTVEENFYRGDADDYVTLESAVSELPEPTLCASFRDLLYFVPCRY